MKPQMLALALSISGQKPEKARPETWLSGQARPGNHYLKLNLVLKAVTKVPKELYVTSHLFFIGFSLTTLPVPGIN